MSLAAVVLSAVAVWVPVPGVKHKHRPRPKPAMRSALASWYALHGGGACGVDDVQSGYRFASLILACGQRIRICHRGCVTATMADHGPYVSSRTFDLNVNLRDALACSDLCSVRWRLA
jgi:hypothetical protein